jgi:DNA sulfur modification protein DndE
MKSPAESIRISKLGRDQLNKLKRQTGIEHFNVLCRWALCLSLREESCPPAIAANAEGGIVIDWRVFAGEFSDVFSALITVRARTDGLGTEPEAIAQCLRLHLHRGLGYLASGKDVNTIDKFFGRWLPLDKMVPANA